MPSWRDAVKSPLAIKTYHLTRQMKAYCITYFLTFYTNSSISTLISENKVEPSLVTGCAAPLTDFITLTLRVSHHNKPAHQFRHCQADLSILAGRSVLLWQQGHRGQGESGHTFLSITGHPAIPIRVIASEEWICCSVMFYHNIMKNAAHLKLP